MVETDFPIEKARLRSTPIYLAIYVIAVIGYGWSLESDTNIAVPLILQFISRARLLIRSYRCAHRRRSWLHYRGVDEHESDAPRRLAARPGVIDHRSCSSFSCQTLLESLLTSSRTILSAAYSARLWYQ
jgi:hypothetical protein